MATCILVDMNAPQTFKTVGKHFRVEYTAKSSKVGIVFFFSRIILYPWQKLVILHHIGSKPIYLRRYITEKEHVTNLILTEGLSEGGDGPQSREVR